jgi:hypothetical protein
MLRKNLKKPAKIASNHEKRLGHTLTANADAIFRPEQANPAARVGTVRVLSEQKLKMNFISGMHTAFTRNGRPSQTQLTKRRFNA